MGYKWCAVPKCPSNTLKTPGKLFICVPKNIKMRRKWLKLSRRSCDHINPTSNMFFCEDHFNLQEDMANYYQYKMGLSQRIIMVDKVLPSKFSCQADRNKRIIYAGTSRSAFMKRQKINLIKECEDTLEEPNTPNNPSPIKVESSENNDQITATVNELITVEPGPKNDKTTATINELNTDQIMVTIEKFKVEPGSNNDQIMTTIENLKVESGSNNDQITAAIDELIKVEPGLNDDQFHATIDEPYTITTPYESFKLCNKSTSTQNFMTTAEKSVQCHLINKVHVRSKAVQTRIPTRDRALSPLRPPLVSRSTSPLKIIKVFVVKESHL